MEEDRTVLRSLPGVGEAGHKLPSVEKTRLDRDIVEDADTRHEQFIEERERWQDDQS